MTPNPDATKRGTTEKQNIQGNAEQQEDGRSSKAARPVSTNQTPHFQTDKTMIKNRGGMVWISWLLVTLKISLK